MDLCRSKAMAACQLGDEEERTLSKQVLNVKELVGLKHGWRQGGRSVTVTGASGGRDESREGPTRRLPLDDDSDTPFFLRKQQSLDAQSSMSRIGPCLLSCRLLALLFAETSLVDGCREGRQQVPAGRAPAGARPTEAPRASTGCCRPILDTSRRGAFVVGCAGSVAAA